MRIVATASIIRKRRGMSREGSREQGAGRIENGEWRMEVGGWMVDAGH
jgi:hypothetical protein